MAQRRGGARAAQAVRELPEQLLQRMLPNAGRAGGKVIAEDAKDRLGTRRAETASGASVLIADTVTVKVRRDGPLVRVRITLTGPGAYVGRWLEDGTKPHFISVDDTVREGRTARRINILESDGTKIIGGGRRVNKEDQKGSLLIGGDLVGTTVHHPGARAHPFLQPALDSRKADAIAAMQTYVNSRAARAGIAGVDSEGGE